MTYVRLPSLPHPHNLNHPPSWSTILTIYQQYETVHLRDSQPESNGPQNDPQRTGKGTRRCAEGSAQGRRGFDLISSWWYGCHGPATV
jgi:hypothetical protein